MIFEGIHISSHLFALKISRDFREFHEENTPSSRTLTDPCFNNSLTLGFFNGALQDRGKKCVMGAIMKLRDNYVFKLRMGCGRGTNTRGELLGVWMFLYFSRRVTISPLHINGDSKVIVYWLRNLCRLLVASLEFWKSKVKKLLAEFYQVEIHHIY